MSERFKSALVYAGLNFITGFILITAVMLPFFGWDLLQCLFFGAGLGVGGFLVKYVLL